MATLTPYSPTDNVISVDSIPMTGFAKGTIIEVERHEDQIKLEVGSDGNGCTVFNPNNSGKITVHLTQESESNLALTELYQAQTIARGRFAFPVSFGQAFGGSYAGGMCWITKPAKQEWSGEHTDRTWVFETLDIDTVIAGGVPLAM